MNITVQNIITWISLTGFVGLAIAQIRTKTRSESGDIVKFYKDRMEDYKVIAETTRKEYTDKHEELLRKFGVLQGEFNTEKALRLQYETILKDKNPETETFMKLVTQAVTDQQEVNKEVVKILAEIHTMAKAEHERDFNITATVTKTP